MSSTAKETAVAENSEIIPTVVVPDTSLSSWILANDVKKVTKAKKTFAACSLSDLKCSFHPPGAVLLWCDSKMTAMLIITTSMTHTSLWFSVLWHLSLLAGS